MEEGTSTQVSWVQVVLALLALLPLLSVLFLGFGGYGYWVKGQYRQAMLVACVYPGCFSLVAACAFPIVSLLRREINGRALLALLVLFSLFAVLLHVPLFSAFTSDPPLLRGTRVINYLNGFSYIATFAGASLGMALGSLIALALTRRRANVS